MSSPRVFELQCPMMGGSHASLKTVPLCCFYETLIMIVFPSWSSCIHLSWEMMEKQLWSPNASRPSTSMMSLPPRPTLTLIHSDNKENQPCHAIKASTPPPHFKPRVRWTIPCSDPTHHKAECPINQPNP